MKVQKNKVVSIDYTLTNQEGELLDSSEGREPLAYLHGAGAIIPGLEEALDGKSVGDEFQIAVPPSQAYGERNDALEQTVPRNVFKDVDDLAVGMQFRVDSDDGPQVITVVEIEDEQVTVDGNHVLAGETLKFDIAVRNVREASAEEIQHGHAHGAGGHQH